MKWVAEPWPLVDPVKQYRGMLIAARGGLAPLPDLIAQTGEDPDRVMASHVATLEWARRHNIALDSIPSTTTLAGQEQESFITDLSENGDTDPEDPPVDVDGDAE